MVTEVVEKFVEKEKKFSVDIIWSRTEFRSMFELTNILKPYSKNIEQI